MKNFFISLILIFIVVTATLAIEYTVVEGDCLWKIAKQFYGNPYMWKLIYNANIDKIKNPDLIYPGQVFYLPELDTTKQEETTTVTQTQEQQLQEVVSEEKSVQGETQPVFPKVISKNDFKQVGKIVAGEEKKFVYIDYDVVKLTLEQGCNVEPGQVLGVYHRGPSLYDLNLAQVKPDQLSLVAKVKVINVEKGEVLCEIIRAYSPVTIGDLVTVQQQ